MKKLRTYPITDELLLQYCAAAFSNAQSLSAESELLVTHGHFARGYFLAVAAIEETGKGNLAFNSLGRNFSDPAVSSKIRISFEQHATKITFAFIPWISSDKVNEATLQKSLTLMSTLRHGREPSMYTDVHENGSDVRQPEANVRKEAATDCIRLARDCLLAATDFVRRPHSSKKNALDDKVFALKSARVKELLNTEDFWRYHIEQLKLGKTFAENLLSYERSSRAADSKTPEQ